MAGTMSRSAWVRMLNEDIAWLYDVPGHDGPSTEKGHVLSILRSLRIVGPLAYNEFLTVERKKRKEEATGRCTCGQYSRLPTLDKCEWCKAREEEATGDGETSGT